MEDLTYDIHRDSDRLDERELGAVRYYDQRFRRLYRLPEGIDSPHFFFACHAALPIALTPDLLYQIWIHFQDERLRFPYEVVSDLLLSGLCRDVRPQLFEMETGVRDYLLQCLRRHPHLGPERERALAQFLLAYASTHYRQAHQQKLSQSQRLTAVAHLDPRRAAREIVEALNDSLDDRSEQRRLGGLVDALNVPLKNLPELLAYGRALEAHLRGRQEKAAQLIAHMPLPADALDAGKLDIAGATLLVTPELRKLIQEQIDRVRVEMGPPERLTRHAKIHLLIHPSLDKQKLVQQLFGWNPPENRSVFVFPWESSLRDIPLIGDINFRVWVWDYQLPPELDRFTLTTGGYYYLAMPAGDLPSQQKEVDSILHRIYSQVGKVDVSLLAPLDEQQTETNDFSVSATQGFSKMFFVRPGKNFDNIMLEALENESGQFIFRVELPEIQPDTPDILSKKNQAGILRYEPYSVPFYKGFESFAPESHLSKMAEIMGKARVNEAWLTGNDLEDAREFEAFQLLQNMGLLYRDPAWPDVWLPKASELVMDRPFAFAGYPSKCLRFTFDFLPCDLGLRLFQCLVNAGGVLLNENPSIIYLYGVPVELRIWEPGLRLEVRIIHYLEKKALKDGSVLASVTDALFELMNNFDGQLLFGYDKTKLAFEILSPWTEDSPFLEILDYYKQWQDGVSNYLSSQGQEKLDEYLNVPVAPLTYAHEVLRKSPSENWKVALEEIVNVIAKCIWQMIGGESINLPEELRTLPDPPPSPWSTVWSMPSPPARLQSYPYAFQFETQILRIPAHATPDLVFIEGGTYPMGDVMDDKEYDDEKPVHDVQLDSFYLGRYAVTFDEYDAFCAATGREKSGDEGWGRDRRPVINVNWYDAVEYCNWLSECWGLTPAYTVDKPRKDTNNKSDSDQQKWLVTFDRNADGYRLPTEAEWEYAARQRGEKVRFGNGKENADPKEINFNASESYKKPYSKVGEYRQKTVPVGSLSSPNSLGLHDMSGNVWEWCWDWFGTYPSDAQKNPVGPDQGVTRVDRGGGWISNPRYCRAAFRHSFGPALRGSALGFRLARSL